MHAMPPNAQEIITSTFKDPNKNHLAFLII